MCPENIGVPAKAAPVQDGLRRLYDSISCLGSNIEEHAERIGPVLGPSLVGNGEDKACTKPATGEILASIDGAVAKVEYLANRISVLTCRLEV